ncbi:MAG: hypothetical protein KDA51_00905, partial [Planctomycetales bacterium]|nr:hypothetical protein [Planctomycetales bacterium]
EKVARLLNHFSELSEAHRTLVRVRQQEELLRPIAEAGNRYRHQLEEVNAARRLLDACDFFFAAETIQLLEPLCDKWQQQIQFLSDEISRLDELQDRKRDAIARLNVDIELAGGDRLRQLPGLIQQALQIATVKSDARMRFEAQLRMGGLTPKLTSPDQFHKTKQQIHLRRSALIEQRADKRQQENKLQFELGSLSKQLAEDRSELEALQRRKNNMPESLIALRDSMCQDLKLAPSDLPYAAELMSVAEDQREWESSIEQVLYGFARSLLVPDDVYARVAGYVDRTRLLDGRGQGQRLVYLKVGLRRETPALVRSQRDTLGTKLHYRQDHPLTPWVKAEVTHRFDYEACETIEQFQLAKGAAMTRNRHLKSGGIRHEKDDRSAPGDRRTFVLGWDNRQKRHALAEAIRSCEANIEQLQQRSHSLVGEIDRTTAAIESLDQAAKIDDYDTIDCERHEFEASQLKLEKKKLEESNDQIRELKAN